MASQAVIRKARMAAEDGRLSEYKGDVEVWKVRGDHGVYAVIVRPRRHPNTGASYGTPHSLECLCPAGQSGQECWHALSVLNEYT